MCVGCVLRCDEGLLSLGASCDAAKVVDTAGVLDKGGVRQADLTDNEFSSCLQILFSFKHSTR